jgi:hypothetical protein
MMDFHYTGDPWIISSLNGFSLKLVDLRPRNASIKCDIPDFDTSIKKGNGLDASTNGVTVAFARGINRP